MKSKERYITKHLIENVDFMELDLQLMSDYGIDPNKMEDLIPIQPVDVVDSGPISIDVLIKSLQGLKKKGASHVALLQCDDHFGYHISAFNIEHSTPAEIREFKKFVKMMEKLMNEDEDPELYPDETPDVKPIGPSAKNA